MPLDAPGPGQFRPARASKRVCAASCGARCCSMRSAAGGMRPTRRSIRSSRWGSSCRRTSEDVAAALAIAREEGVPVLPRGGGTSQCGQTVARALVIDCSKYLDRVIAVDVEGAARAGAARGRAGPAQPRCCARTSCSSRSMPSTGEPRDDRRHDRQQQLRLALDPLRQHGAQRARRSTRCWPTAPQARFGEVPGNFERRCASPSAIASLVRDMRALHRREADEIERRFPKVLRRVGGYNIDMHRRQRPQHGAAAGRLGGHARLLQRDRARTAADPGAPGARHLPFPDLLPGDGCDPAHRRAGPERGRAGRPHDDRAGARHPDVPPGRRPLRAGRARRDPVDRVRRRRRRRESAAAQGSSSN